MSFSLTRASLCDPISRGLLRIRTIPPGIMRQNPKEKLAKERKEKIVAMKTIQYPIRCITHPPGHEERSESSHTELMLSEHRDRNQIDVIPSVDQKLTLGPETGFSQAVVGNQFEASSSQEHRDSIVSVGV